MLAMLRLRKGSRLFTLCRRPPCECVGSVHLASVTRPGSLWSDLRPLPGIFHSQLPPCCHPITLHSSCCYVTSGRAGSLSPSLRQGPIRDSDTSFQPIRNSPARVRALCCWGVLSQNSGRHSNSFGGKFSRRYMLFIKHYQSEKSASESNIHF